MSRSSASLPARYFEELYAKDPDPWGFATSPYEREKYAATLAALGRPRYESALEVGCAIGVLTEKLAARCARLTALDVAEAALAQARARCAAFSNVRFQNARVPADWPRGRFDLFLLSEVLYYLDHADLSALASHMRASACAGADVVLVHWLGETDYPLSGDAAADGFIRMSAGFARLTRQTRTAAYRLDVLQVGNDPGAGAG